MRFPLKAALLALLLATSACATTVPWDGGSQPSLSVGMSQSQVEAAFGPPTRAFVDPEGYATWSYLRQDDGTGPTRAATELTVRFAGERVFSYSQSTSTTTTTTTVTP